MHTGDGPKRDAAKTPTVCGASDPLVWRERRSEALGAASLEGPGKPDRSCKRGAYQLSATIVRASFREPMEGAILEKRWY